MIGCAYCITRERLREWLLRLKEVKSLRRDIKETQVLMSALRSMAQRYYKLADKGSDKRTFEEVLRSETNRFEIVQRKIM